MVETSPHKILLCQEKNNYTGKISMVSNYEIQVYVTSTLLTEPVSTSKLKWCNWKVISTLLEYCVIHFPLLCGSPWLFSYSYWAYFNNLQSIKSIIFATRTYNLELNSILLYFYSMVNEIWNTCNWILQLKNLNLKPKSVPT